MGDAVPARAAPATQRSRKGVSGKAGIPIAVTEIENIFIPEMVGALDELHGCLIRRPGDTCEVRKEYLSVAISVMAAVIGEAMAPESSVCSDEQSAFDKALSQLPDFCCNFCGEPREKLTAGQDAFICQECAAVAAQAIELGGQG